MTNKLTLKGKQKPPIAPLVGYPLMKINESSAHDNLKNAETQAETLRLYYEQANPDLVFTFMDLAVEAEALGLKVKFHQNDPPDVSEHPVSTLEDLDTLQKPFKNPKARFSVFAQTIDILDKSIDASVVGYVASPFTLAGLLIGAETLAIKIVMDPDFCRRILDFAMAVCCEYAKILQDAGAGAIVFLEPTAVMISPRMFDEFVSPYVDQCLDGIDIPGILHVCGQTTNHIPSFCKTKAKGFSLDADVSLSEVATKIPSDRLIIGNIHPVKSVSVGTPSRISKDVAELVQKMKNHDNFVLSTGCDVPYEAPLSNIMTFIDTGRALK